MVIYSPLRYPGGKSNLTPYIKQIIKDNLLCDCTYVEPYAGGASVALALLLDGYVSKIIINDIDKSIFAFWYSILNDTNNFCRLIEETPVDIKVWKNQRAKQKIKNKCDLLELGFSTFFLNRANRSGIIQGGVIGGLKQNGKWKIDARFNKTELINRIKRISCYKDSIKLYNMDASKLIKLLRTRLANKNVLIYFDPPYYNKGKNLYLNYYSDADHKELSNQIKKLTSQKWILTYDNVQQIKKLYSEYRQRKYKLTYSASKPIIGQELMIFSDNLYCGKVFVKGEKV